MTVTRPRPGQWISLFKAHMSEVIREFLNSANQTTIMLVILALIQCFVWYDMQNRFGAMGNRIIENQSDIKKSVQASQRTEADVKSVRAALQKAHADISSIEKDAKSMKLQASLAAQALQRTKQNESGIETNVAEIDRLRKASDEGLRQAQQNAAQITHTDELLRELIQMERTNQLRITEIHHRTEDIFDKLQKLADHTRRN